MLPLSSDESFHYELLRMLALARYQGGDIAEILKAAGEIEAGNFESFATTFERLATRVHGQATQIDAARHPVSARDAYFRAATYYRAADFFLHGNPADPRIQTLWTQQGDAFDRAMSLMPVPGRRISVRADGFDVPGIFFAAAAAGDATARPAVIVGTGYDGAQEEMLHVCGLAALERGYHVLLYEGPGQPTVVRQQGRGFVAAWERVVTPLVDYLETLPGVDAARIGLLGCSMGGFLAVRAAAFEHRLAAVWALDGVYDVFEAYYNLLPPRWRDLFDSEKSEDHEVLDAEVKAGLASGSLPAKIRWGIEQGCWSFCTPSPWSFLAQTKAMTMKGIASQIQCPVWIGDAVDDQFFQGQPQKMKEALGDKGTLAVFTDEDAAGNHCHVGAMAHVNASMFDWFDDKIAA